MIVWRWIFQFRSFTRKKTHKKSIVPLYWCMKQSTTDFQYTLPTENNSSSNKKTPHKSPPPLLSEYGFLFAPFKKQIALTNNKSKQCLPKIYIRLYPRSVCTIHNVYVKWKHTWRRMMLMRIKIVKHCWHVCYVANMRSWRAYRVCSNKTPIWGRNTNQMNISLY